MAGESIDPRYAAQFQRGYDGPAVTGDGRRETQSTRDAPVRIGGGPSSSATRVPPPPPVRSVQDVHAVVPDPEPVGEGEPEMRQNRLEWALLIVGILMIVTAPALLYGYATDNGYFAGTGMPDVAAQMRLAFLSLAPGPLLAAGAIAVALWIVVRGLRIRGTT